MSDEGLRPKFTIDQVRKALDQKKVRRSPRIALTNSFNKFKNTEDNPVDLTLDDGASLIKKNVKLSTKDTPVIISPDDGTSSAYKNISKTTKNMGDIRISTVVDMFARRKGEDNCQKTPKKMHCDLGGETKSNIERTPTPTKKINEFFVELPKVNDPDDDFVSVPKPQQQSSSPVFFKYDEELLKPRIATHKYYKYLKNLNENQKDKVKEIGFGSILGMKINHVPTKIGYWLLRNFDHTTGVLNIGEARILITSHLLHQLLGVPAGPVLIKEMLRARGSNPIVGEWNSQFNKKHIASMSPNELFAYLKGKTDSGRMFVLNFLVAFCSMMGEVSSNNSLNRKFLTSIREGVDVKQLNWCEYILRLMKRSRAGWNLTEEYNGSVIPLVLAYASFKMDTVKNASKLNPAIMRITFDDIDTLVLSLSGFGEIRHKSKQKEIRRYLEKKRPKLVPEPSKKGVEKEDMAVNKKMHLHIDGVCMKRGVRDGCVQGDEKKNDQVKKNAVNVKQNLIFERNDDTKVNELVDVPVTKYNEMVKDQVTDSVVGIKSRMGVNSSHDKIDETVTEIEEHVVNNPKEMDVELTPVATGSSATNEDNDNNPGGLEGLTQGTRTAVELDALKLVDYIHDWEHKIGEITEGLSVLTSNYPKQELVLEVEKLWKSTIAKHFKDDHTAVICGSKETTSMGSPGFLTPRTLEELDAIEQSLTDSKKRTPKSQTLVLSFPRYDLGSSARTAECSGKKRGKKINKNVEDIFVADYLIDGDEVEEDATKNGESRRSKRPRTFGDAMCSPYVQRVVQLRDPIVKSESLVADMIFSCYGGIWDEIFHIEGGMSLGSVVMETLRPKVYVHINAVSAWSSVPNIEEKLRQKGTTHRLFYSAVMLFELHYGKTKETRLEHFTGNMVSILAQQELDSIKNVDLVFIPILYPVRQHFYVMVYNMNNGEILLLDNIRCNATFSTCYNNWPQIMTETFADYLDEVQHPVGTKIRSAEIKVLDFPWRTTNNFVDCGVFTMRHMETFKGSNVTEWGKVCGLSNEFDITGMFSEKQQTELNDLRRKYVAKILLSNVNRLKNEVLHRALLYDALPIAEKISLNNSAHARLEARLEEVD